jgi:cation transport regulator
MPHSTNAELPALLQRSLPHHAQDIYRQAFNHALQRYGSEEIAHRVAWAAVKKSYQKLGDHWRPRFASSDPLLSITGSWVARGEGMRG